MTVEPEANILLWATSAAQSNSQLGWFSGDRIQSVGGQFLVFRFVS